MDDQRFDALTRTIGTFFSRRRVWQPLASIAGVASGGLLGLDEAKAKKKKKKKKKKKRKPANGGGQPGGVVPPPVRIEPVYEFESLKRDARQLAAYRALDTYLEEHIRPTGYVDGAESISVREQLARTVLLRGYNRYDSGQEALLAYVVDASGAVSVAAIITQGTELTDILVVDGSGKVQVIAPQDAARIASREEQARAQTQAEAQVSDYLCQVIGLTCPDVDNPCFQCKFMCRTYAMLLERGLGFSCKTLALQLCAASGPLYGPCIVSAWGICQDLSGRLVGANCDQVICQISGSCCPNVTEWDYPDQRYCNGRCLDASKDPNHCGGCGRKCGSGEVCASGRCLGVGCGNGPLCPSGQVCVAGGCVSDSEYRIVLSWGSNPVDLDGHLWLPSGSPYHIWFDDPGQLIAFPYTFLDQDDTDSFGPETITISQLRSGTYTYAVQHYYGTGTIGTSGATVKLYKGGTLLRTFTPPVSSGWTDRNGNQSWWKVFTLDSSGNITSINAPSSNPAPYLDAQLARTANDGEKDQPNVEEKNDARLEGTKRQRRRHPKKKQ